MQLLTYTDAGNFGANHKNVFCLQQEMMMAEGVSVIFDKVRKFYDTCL